MTDSIHTPNVGAPDPELKTSPIADENNDDTDSLKQQVPGETACYFNDNSYPHGTSVKSGTMILKCDYGIWIPAGPADPDNP